MIEIPAVSFKVHYRQLGGHVHVLIRTSEHGPETTHGTNGTLVFRDAEWQAFSRILASAAAALHARLRRRGDTPMTTPAHCTRTDPHPAHDWDDRGLLSCPGCPGVEPPADAAATPDFGTATPGDLRLIAAATGGGIRSKDAAATPDPRLDVVEPCPTRWRGFSCERHADGWHRCDGTEHPFGGHECICGHDAPSLVVSAERPAPAGLSAAQEIQAWVSFGADIATNAIAAVATVEHGDDETPAPVHDSRLDDARERATAANEVAIALVGELEECQEHRDRAEARADLASARLGLIFDALQDANLGSLVPTGPVAERTILFIEAVRAALEWTPDDTATAGADTTRCARCGADWPIASTHGEGLCEPPAPAGAATDSITGHTIADVQRLARAWIERNDTAPAGATEDGDGLQ